MRARAPQAGDYWPGCNSARAAGTAPIYDGEPGYREEMDGDGDGIACEPHHGI
ncbi:excalibur calcium-binding domain-containing protein [Sphingobium sp. MAH-33]|uniref:Excalibur calcium-binding domain-containing protein n=2 Tax=Sphingomonadaceae TaxID=41297 RepID=A0ABT0E1W1_9SPHN|nr:excalibur calcium-binding domain-containing protein [Sphingobium agri]